MNHPKLVFEGKMTMLGENVPSYSPIRLPLCHQLCVSFLWSPQSHYPERDSITLDVHFIQSSKQGKCNLLTDDSELELELLELLELLLLELLLDEHELELEILARLWCFLFFLDFFLFFLLFFFLLYLTSCSV